MNETPVESPAPDVTVPEAPEVPDGECGDGGQNLHDFVYSLLVDIECRSAFDQDPSAALSNAGLSDISAADVQDVVPLVADSLPVGAQDLNLDGLLDGSVADGPAGAISQLQLVTQQLLVAGDSAGLNVGLATPAGDLGISTQGLSVDIDATSAFGGVSTTLGAPGGLALEGGLTADSPFGDFVAGGVVDGLTATGTFSSDSVVGQVVDTVTGQEGGFTIAGDAAEALSGEAFGLEGNMVSETLSTGVTNVTYVADNALSDPVGILTEALTNPTDTVSAVASQAQALIPADLPAALPLNALPTGALPLGALPLGALPLDALPLDALPTDALQSLPMDLPTTLPAGGIPADLPVDALGTATGAVQGAVGQVAGSLPVQLPTDLPANLPTDLPTGAITGAVGQVQDTVTGVVGGTGVSDVVTNSPVGDVVSQTGLGDVINQVQPTDVVGTVQNILPTDGLLG